MEAEYRNITVKRGPTHEYLGMLLEYGGDGKVLVSMQKYTEKLLEVYGVSTVADDPAPSSLFDIDPEGVILESKKRE